MHNGNTFTDSQKQAIVMALDLSGYEQDGDGLAFICLASGKRKTFATWQDALEFVSGLNGL